jgi:hypothetical protein
MKTVLTLFLLLFFFQFAHAISFPKNTDTTRMPHHPAYIKQIATIKPATIEKLTGKKLSFGDKLKLKILQKKLKKQYAQEDGITPKQKKLGLWSMILGLASIGLIFIGAGATFVIGILAAIAAVVLGFKSVKGNTNAMGLIGIIAGFLTLLLTLLAAVVIATWGGFF